MSCSISPNVSEGVYHILFHPRWFGHAGAAQSDETIRRAIESVPRYGFTLRAYHSIDEYEAGIGAVRGGIGRLLDMEVTLHPNFTEIFNREVSIRSDTSWHRDFGRRALRYFVKLQTHLDRPGMS